MKKNIFIMLFFLLFLVLVWVFTGLNPPQSTLESTYQDVQWGLNVQKNMRILKTDFDNISIATNKSDYNALAVAAQYEIDHTQKAIEENDQYQVSSKLQEPQNKWREGLQDYNSAGKFLLEGANEAKRGRNGFESFQKAAELSKSGTTHLKKASEVLGVNAPLN